MAFENVRPFILDTSGMANALEGLFAGIKKKKEDAGYGELLNSLTGGGGPAPTPSTEPANALARQPGPAVPQPQQPSYGVQGGARNALFDMGSLAQSSGPNEMMTGNKTGWRPSNVILHDYGGNPANQDGVFNPYHALVFPDGSIRYRNADDPYGSKAPHAYKMNGDAIGLSYAGPVGSKPTPAALETLRKEYTKINQMFPGIKAMSHGEAFNATRGTSRQASKLGRGLDEASWRADIRGDGGQAPAQASASPPVAGRSLTAYAGSQPPQVADASGNGDQARMLAWARANPGHPAAKAIASTMLEQRMDPMSGLNMQAKQLQVQGMLDERQRSNLEMAAKRASAVAQMPVGPERAAMWSRVLDQHRIEHPDDEITAEEADPVSGPQIMLTQAGVFLDPRKRELENRKTEAEIKKLEREAAGGGDKYGKQGAIFQDPKTGEYYSIQFSESGEKLIEPITGLAPSRGVGEADTGLGTRLYDKATGRDIRTIDKDLAGAEAAKASGRVAGENMANAPKARASLASANAKTDIVKKAIAAARPMVSSWSAGAGSLLSILPNTTARDLSAQKDIIIANLGFDELQDMRNNSPTGGALGAIAVQELQMLQSTKVSLDQAQTVGQFLKALSDLEGILAGAQERRQAAFEATYGGGAMPQFNPAPAGQGAANRVSTKEEYDALPPGTSYTAPDGSIRTKPRAAQ